MSRIFALPAPGFDTMEFFDEAADQADDLGLLSWLIGSVSNPRGSFISLAVSADDRSCRQLCQLSTCFATPPRPSHFT